jgi:hypothetical protein
MAEPDEHPLLTKVLTDVRAKAQSQVDANVKKGVAGAADRLVETIAESVPDVTPVDGFFLGLVKHQGEPWMLLYRDRGLQDWILVPDSARKAFQRNKDAEGKQVPDTVWVERSALILAGKGAHTVELMFLTGSFTTAGDLDQTLGSRDLPDGGLYSPLSPYGGCGRKSSG